MRPRAKYPRHSSFFPYGYCGMVLGTTSLVHTKCSGATDTLKMPKVHRPHDVLAVMLSWTSSLSHATIPATPAPKMAGFTCERRHPGEMKS